MRDIKILITEEEINKRLDEIANQIMKEYEEREIVFICVLKGSIFFTVELAKRIKNNIQFEFMEISSYENNKRMENLKINKDISRTIEGKDVIIIEDIVDSGNTISFLKNYLKQKKPNTLKICTLLDKPSRRIIEVEAEYVGFVIEDKFIVGYGLDDNQNYRNLNYIGYIEI